MTDRDLFLLHPVAWQHAQAIRDAESEMLRNGIGRKKRVEFLKTELKRVLNQAPVIIGDAMSRILSDLGLKDTVQSLDTIQARFDALGFRGTLRQIRNLNRLANSKLGALDQLLFWGA